MTYSDNYNFIVRYLPGPIHWKACQVWDLIFMAPLMWLCKTPKLCPPGCSSIRRTGMFGSMKSETEAYLSSSSISSRLKQEETSRCWCHLRTSPLPSLVLEVSVSESLIQLRHGAKLWLKNSPQVTHFSPQSFISTHYNSFRYR